MKKELRVIQHFNMSAPVVTTVLKVQTQLPVQLVNMDQELDSRKKQTVIHVNRVEFAPLVQSKVSHVPKVTIVHKVANRMRYRVHLELTTEALVLATVPDVDPVQLVTFAATKLIKSGLPVPQSMAMQSTRASVAKSTPLLVQLALFKQETDK